MIMGQLDDACHGESLISCCFKTRGAVQKVCEYYGNKQHGEVKSKRLIQAVIGSD